MSADQQRQFPGWDAMYQNQAIETMPWFYPELDDDLKQALDALGVRGGSALDLGLGRARKPCSSLIGALM